MYLNIYRSIYLSIHLSITFSVTVTHPLSVSISLSLSITTYFSLSATFFHLPTLRTSVLGPTIGSDVQLAVLGVHTYTAGRKRKRYKMCYTLRIMLPIFHHEINLSYEYVHRRDEFICCQIFLCNKEFFRNIWFYKASSHVTCIPET